MKQITLKVTVGGAQIVECGLCSAMVPILSIDHHCAEAHPGWNVQLGANGMLEWSQA